MIKAIKSKLNNMKKAIIISTIVSLVFLFQFCSNKDSSVPVIGGAALNLPLSPFNYAVNYPLHIQNALVANDNMPANNQITNNGATLGRVLFYDKNLSKNNIISCASCHKQNISFDDNLIKSVGFEGGTTTRKSMPLLNVRFYSSGKMFWDERAANLEVQVLQPIQDHVEMGLTLTELEIKVKAQSFYFNLFEKAFGNTEITSEKIAKALAQFVRSMITYQSKYDKVKQGLDKFTQAESAGEQLFLNAGAPGTCASCHTPPMFINSNPGRGFALADINDKGINGQNRFKSPSLRNISIRTNLFHNGSIANVLIMLNSGAPGNGSAPIPLHTVAPQDVQNMLAFLNTLTDINILTDEKFKNPFQ